MAIAVQNSEMEAPRNPPAVSLAPAPAPAAAQIPLSAGLPASSSTILTSSLPQASSTSTNASRDPTSTLPSQDPPAPVLSPTPVPAATPTSNAGPLSTTPCQQRLSSQNPPAATPSSTPIHIVTSGTPNSHATPVPAPPKHHPRTQQSSITKPIGTKLWASRPLIFALVIVSLVDGLALSAPSANSPLGSISNTNGILILSILATLTGYSLSAAAKTVWDRAPFRLFANEQSSGLSLTVFWTLTSGVGGSCLILWREFCKLLHRNSKSNNPKVNTKAHSHQRVRGHPKLWSTLRIASWAAMQFPGIIIMTIVNPETSYIPNKWTRISGGIGIYDPKAVVSDAAVLATNSALSILQDPTRAVQVDPVNLDCIQSTEGCKAFLIPGGLQNVSPWPYQKMQDTTLDVYVTKGGPAYQVDFWSPPQNVTWPDEDCTVYAANEDESFQLCTSLNTDGKTIMAGWTPCIGTVLPSGDCSQEGSWEAFNYTATFISISRRTATVYAMRDTSTIVAWENLGEPEFQIITPSDFQTAFAIMVTPWTNESSILPPSDSTVQLTALIASTLELGLEAPESSKSLDYLFNFFATPLYIFNPLLLGLSGALPAISDVQPNLPPENYINGSYARIRIHAVPERWTVLAYVVVSGVLLLACFVGLIVGTGYNGPELSEFPFIDSLKLKWVVAGGNGREVEDIGEVFRGVDLADNVEVLEHAARVRVKLRTAINQAV